MWRKLTPGGAFVERLCRHVGVPCAIEVQGDFAVLTSQLNAESCSVPSACLGAGQIVIDGVDTGIAIDRRQRT